MQTPFVNGCTENYSPYAGLTCRVHWKSDARRGSLRFLAVNGHRTSTPNPKAINGMDDPPRHVREKHAHAPSCCCWAEVFFFSAHACRPPPLACVDLVIFFSFRIFNLQSMNFLRQTSISVNKPICSTKNWSSTNINLQSCSTVTLNLTSNFTTWTSCSFFCHSYKPVSLMV